LTVVVGSPHAQTNTATISHSDQFDPNPGNDAASSTLTPQQANLLLAKTVNDPTPNVGEIVTYTITLTNNGPDTATNVQTADRLPAGLSFVSAAPSQGTYDPASGTWTVGTVTTSSPQTLMIRARVVSPTPGANIATITHSDQFEISPGDNTDGVALLPQQADLALAKTVSNTRPNVGDMIAYTITLANIGPDAATNVRVTDVLPAGLSFLADTPSQGTYSPTSGIWSVGTVNLGAPEALVIFARVISPVAQINTAMITHSDQFDPAPGNNSASAVVTPPAADLVVAKEASDPSPLVGETMYFVVAVANRGPAAAVGVAVADALPPGLAFVSAAPSVGTYNPATGIWWVGGLADGATATLVVFARATAPVVAINTAIVASADFDPDLANNVASTAVTIRTPTPPAVVSLARYGFHTQPTSLVLGFNTSLVAAAAQAVANYQIVEIGPLGNTSAPIPIASAIYDAATDTVTLNPSRQLYLFGYYVLTVNGMAPSGLISTTGIRLGGTTVGGPGANFVRVFGREILAGPNPAVQLSLAAATPAYRPSPAAVDAALATAGSRWW
jgi:uncharacterized repeat protein (TIGR01451 family)